ncbi:MAG: hypothetical protein IJ001_09530 [Oscillospiraceae bacterium]|nr:hypothetical protein [Oscillospiraceae bacterium]
MEQNTTMKERLLDPSNKSDIPTITYVTPKAIIFFVAVIATIVSMFSNWFAMDLDLGYFQLNDVLGTVNVFRMPVTLGEIEESIGMFSAFLPGEVKTGFAIIKLVSIVLMLVGAVAIVSYAYAAFLRLQKNDKTAKFGRLGALCAVLTVVGFISMVIGLLFALDASSAIGNALSKILSGPCTVTLLGALASGYCAVMDVGFKEDVVIYHNGILKIDKGPKWRCRCCHKKNLSRLEKCYYCGTEKKQN